MTRLLSIFAIIASAAILLSACANTANGMQKDWKANTQAIANSTGN